MGGGGEVLQVYATRQGLGKVAMCAFPTALGPHLLL